MIKRTLAVLVTALVATAASAADPPATGAPPTGTLLTDVRTAISEIVIDIRDGLSSLFRKPRADSQCRPSKK